MNELMMMVLSSVWAMEEKTLFALWETLRSASASPGGLALETFGRGGGAVGRPVTAEGTSNSDAAKVPRGEAVRIGRASVISIKGPMGKGSWIEWWGGTDTSRARRSVLAAAADSQVDSIILDVDSPGGTVDGTDDLGVAVAMAAKVKPVIAQVGGMAASAAYWVASQASEIRAQRSDMVGSIGVRCLLFDTSKYFEEAGVRPVLVDTGTHKSTGAPGVPVSAEQEAELRRVVDRLYEEFLGAVMSGRGLSKKALMPYADGRMFFADEALAAGLVDRITPRDATLGEAVRDAAAAERSRRARAVLL